jgi:tRNA pseudouridine38-40 synthase
VLIEIEYDGSGFSGWQIQPEARTVQGELMRALSIVCGEEIRLNGTSRTDAGVHAYCQAATFTGEFGIPAERIPLAANNLMNDVKILSARDMPHGFHARFDARGKTYLYRISVTEPDILPDIFLRNYRWQLTADRAGSYIAGSTGSESARYSDSSVSVSDAPLDTEKMREAAQALIGTHDFSSFRSAGSNPDVDPVKTLSDITIDEFIGADTRMRPQTEYEIRVTGSGFLYNMVRIIVGTLAEVGLGKRPPESVAETLAAKDRPSAGPTAPASGLWLEKVHFEEID